MHVLIVHFDNFSGHTVSTAHYVLCGRCVSLAAAAASQLLLSQLVELRPASSSSRVGAGRSACTQRMGRAQVLPRSGRGDSSLSTDIEHD